MKSRRAAIDPISLAVIGVIVLLSGCSSGAGRTQIAAQAPGVVSGAGVSFTGPTNSGQPSKVSGKRTVTRYEWPRFDLEYFDRGSPPAPSAAAAPVVSSAPSAAVAAAPAALSPIPVVEQEEFSAEIGAHQDLASILKQAAKLVNEWGWLRIVGVLVILGGVGFAVWSMGNPGGYTVVGWGFAGCGVVFLFAAGNPAWLLLLCLPFGFYVAQKMNLVRLPDDQS